MSVKLPSVKLPAKIVATAKVLVTAGSFIQAGSAPAAFAQTHIDIEHRAQPLGPGHRLAEPDEGTGVLPGGAGR